VVSVVRAGVYWTYFVGIQPVFRHEQSDHRSFRMFTAQLVCQGACRQMDIVRSFGVSPISVKRAVKRYRRQGVAGFYRPRKGRGGGVLTAAVLSRAQELLDGGGSRSEVAAKLEIKPDTLRKAIHQGRLHEAKSAGARKASDQSERSQADAAAGAEMGTACTRPGERMLCALGMLEGAPTRFEACRDVSFGGVLCALPALALNGLFRHLESCFQELRGYYRVVQVITLLADMALCRIKTAEQLQYHPPGELGKLRGLDRVPEVRTLRRKLKEMSQGEAPAKWAGLLSRDWLEQDPESAGVLYVDGHVRVYHGGLTELPRRYVSRDRLCLRGTTDYWVNDALGRPFFVVEKPADPGLLEVLENEIVPRLLREVPGQPSRQELEENPEGARFLLVFDRQGYSPGCFKRMWNDHRIACLTYHKYPGDPWPVEQFQETAVALPGGETVTLKLAERGTPIGSGKDRLWVREVRKLSQGGHQTSLITTAYADPGQRIAAWMFSRWAQENFFRYMMQDFAIDLLAEYRTEGFHDPPRWSTPPGGSWSGSTAP
jgi:prepilin-type processing-associated H-X9-DG protein